MKIQDLLGDAYKADMTLAEIETLLADKHLVDPSTLPKSVDKSVFDKTASELAATKKALKELQESSMTADERIQAELAKAAEAQKTYAKELSKLKAKEVFVSAGLSEADYSSILDSIVSEDETATLTLSKGMVNLIAAQKTATEKALRAELLKGTPKPGAGTPGVEAMTKEKFLSLASNEQEAYIKENPDWQTALK